MISWEFHLQSSLRREVPQSLETFCLKTICLNRPVKIYQTGMRQESYSFLPVHLERVCAAVDQLPDPEVLLVEPPLPNGQALTPSNQDDSQSGLSYSEQSTPILSSCQTSEPVFKEPERKGTRR